MIETVSIYIVYVQYSNIERERERCVCMCSVSGHTHSHPSVLTNTPAHHIE